MSKKFIISLITFLLSAPGLCRDYTYSELLTLDIEERALEVNERVTDAEQLYKEGREEHAKHALRDALKYILSRPNRDNEITKLIPLVRQNLNNLNELENSVKNITQEAIALLKQKKGPVQHQATAYFILLNMMSEFQPDVERNEKIKVSFELVRDADINKLPKRVQSELNLNAMVTSPRPLSEVATKVVGPAKSESRKRGWFRWWR